MDQIVADSYETLPDSAPFVAHLTAGALAGITEHTITYPFDVIKTRMQAIAGQSHSVLSSFRQIYRLEGPSVLFRGVLSVALGAGPAHALYFASYEESKHRLSNWMPSLPVHLVNGISGAFATALADALMNPFDVIKQRMQVAAATGTVKPLLMDTAKSILRNEGMSAFYTSYGTTLFLNVPYQAIQFVIYEATSKHLNPEGTYNPISHMAAGALAGSIAAAATTPLDCVKTLLQTRTVSNNAMVRNASGLFQGIRILLHLKGWRGLWMGWKPRVMAMMPSTAICWTTYEYFKHFIGAQ